jgi:hypothetical protein
LHQAALKKETEHVRMPKSKIPLVLTLTLTASWLGLGCGASFPVPTQDLSEAVSAERGAVELGAPNHPEAQLHLALAREQIAQANIAIKDGDNGRADTLLRRARADAELAIALTRDQKAKTGAKDAAAQSNAQTTVNNNQGATP